MFFGRETLKLLSNSTPITLCQDVLSRGDIFTRNRSRPRIRRAITFWNIALRCDFEKGGDIPCK
jgi:hypothetical protein